MKSLSCVFMSRECSMESGGKVGGTKWRPSGRNINEDDDDDDLTIVPALS